MALISYSVNATFSIIQKAALGHLVFTYLRNNHHLSQSARSQRSRAYAPKLHHMHTQRLGKRLLEYTPEKMRSLFAGSKAGLFMLQPLHVVYTWIVIHKVCWYAIVFHHGCRIFQRSVISLDLSTIISVMWRASIPLAELL